VIKYEAHSLKDIADSLRGMARSLLSVPAKGLAAEVLKGKADGLIAAARILENTTLLEKDQASDSRYNLGEHVEAL
jgi:hypothetical protein